VVDEFDDGGAAWLLLSSVDCGGVARVVGEYRCTIDLTNAFNSSVLAAAVNAPN
jgi:hypothetical protein